ncbi:MAG: TonB-dependent receptor [Sphingomonadales bacterium 28-55-16]|nr:MAG: TonB-dependent receptor [Sphingomonadales bacterium 28-55-16]
MKNTRISNLKYAAAPLALGLALISTPSFAQDAAAEEETGSEIVVTGSLISNPNLEASAPVNVVSEKEMELQQANVAEELLRELPGAVPSVGSAVNNGNGGASFVNLRNLGSNRNLVLIDGVRLVPANLSGVFDLNNIPLALVQRVDVLTGGASTTYGADAVAGVVNFITRQDFAGLDLSVSNQITEKGDGNTFRADLTLGANFDDGRGNAVLSLGYQQADPVYQGDRDFGRFGIASASGAGGGSGTAVPSRFTLPGVGTRQVDSAGTAFLPTSAYQNFNFNPYNLYQTPFERFNMYGAARYEVSDAVEIYTRGLFSKNTVDTIIAPSGAFAVPVDIPLNNPYLTTALRNSFCSANSISAADCALAANSALTPGQAGYRTVTSSLSRRAVEVGPRISSYTTDIFDYRVGAKGSLTDTVDWDVFGSYGQSTNTQTIKNYVLKSRVKESLLANNVNSCFSGTSASCVPINWFGPAGSITPAAVDFLVENSTVSTKVSMAQVHGVVNGDFGLKAPWSEEPVGFAVGGEFRKYTASQESDTLAQGGDLGGSGGAAPNISGGFNVYEAFGELIVPVVQDKPFFYDLTLEGGARYSKYSVDAPNAPSFDTFTWKAGGSWSPIEQLKIRGSYARAVRAPNISELFSPVNTGLTNLADDPCARYDDTGTAIRSAPTGEIRAICLAQGAKASNVDFIAQPTAGQANSTGGGNLGLKPEKSTSWTIGAVIQPITGLSLSVDYFNIEITGAVSSPTPDDAISACFGASNGAAVPVYSPAAGASTTEACRIIRRDPLAGGLAGDPSTTAGLFLSSSNLGTLKTSGVDFTAGYNRDLGFAGLDLNVVLTWNNESKFRPGPSSDFRECIGFYSANCMPPQPEWQLNARSTLNFDGIDVSLLWRHMDKLSYEPGQGTLFSGTLPASAGPIAGKQVNFNKIDARDYFDLTTRFPVNENFTVTLGVQNLLNSEPPLVGGEAGSTSFNSGNTFPSSYDALGRRYVASARIRF